MALLDSSNRSTASQDRQRDRPPRVRWELSSLLDCDPVNQRIWFNFLFEVISKRMYQYAIFEILCGPPMEHARAVVLHFSLFKVEIFRLVVRQADGERNPVAVLISAAAGATRRPRTSPSIASQPSPNTPRQQSATYRVNASSFREDYINSLSLH